MTYMCIDLKSFYASCEARFRNLDPLKVNLVVADESRTEKTICLAVSPSLKQYGIPGRARLFEVISKVKEINKERLKNNNYKKFINKSYDDDILKNNKNYELDFIIAKPQMQKYIDVSSYIYSIYLKYVSKEDIHIYSIDEVFIDITTYLKLYNLNMYDFAKKIATEVFLKTGITATVGLGDNMYLAKVAMDIVAKHIKPNENGLKISYLNQELFKEKLWHHKPLSSFWRIGINTERRLNDLYIYTLKDLARVGIENPDILYKEFGINAELLIDHAFGYESATIKDIKEYKPKNNVFSKGQVLHEAYDYKKMQIIIKEMVDDLANTLLINNLYTSTFGLYIGYEKTDLNLDLEYKENYYGIVVPKGINKSIKFKPTNSKIELKELAIKLFLENVNKDLLMRRINIAFSGLIYKEELNNINYEVFDLFSNVDEKIEENKNKKIKNEKEKNIENTIINLKNKYGKNAVIKGLSLEEGATQIERNKQIGGHKA